MDTSISRSDIQQKESFVMQRVKIDESISFDALKVMIAKGGKFVIFKYQISLFFAISFVRFSPAIFIQAGDCSSKYARKYNLLSILFGWWYFPDGPYDTIQALIYNRRGGLDVSQDIILNMDEKGFAQREFEYKVTGQLFSKPDKWNLKSYRKTLLKCFERDFAVRMIVAADFINTNNTFLEQHIFGIRTKGDFDKCTEVCRQALSEEFRKYALFEFIDLDLENEVNEFLIEQGEVILLRT